MRSRTLLATYTVLCSLICFGGWAAETTGPLRYLKTVSLEPKYAPHIIVSDGATTATQANTYIEILGERIPVAPGITTATLTGAGVVDVTTTSPNYAMIGLSSLSPRTDQDTTWTGSLTGTNVYAYDMDVENNLNVQQTITADVVNASTIQGTDVYGTFSGNGAAITDIIAEHVEVPDGEGTPSYDDLQDWLNVTRASGRLSGGVLTPHAPADGTVDISAMEAMIHTTDAVGGTYIYKKFPAQASLALTDGAVNWIYCDYTTSLFAATTDRSTVHEYDQFVVGRTFRQGTAVEVMSTGHTLANRARIDHNRIIGKYGMMDRESGGIISETGTRNLSVTDGVWWAGESRYTTTGYDTSASGDFNAYWRSGASAWTKVTGLTQIPNTQYNRLSDNTLQDLTANRYGVYWVFLCPEGEIYLVYGQGDYTLAQAEASTVPSSLPPYCVNWSRLVGRIIIQKGDSAAHVVESVFTESFDRTAATNHNDLAGLQGGTAAEYYHLTAAELASIGSGDSSAGITTLTLTGGGWIDVTTSSPNYAMINPSAAATANLAKAHTQNTDIGTNAAEWKFGMGRNLASTSYTLSFGEDNASYWMWDGTASWQASHTVYVPYLGIWVDGTIGGGAGLLGIDSAGDMTFDSITPKLVGYGPKITFNDYDEGVDRALAYDFASTRLTFDGDIGATSYYGDGSHLTGITATGVLSTSTLELSEQATTPSTPSAGNAIIWASQKEAGTRGIDKSCKVLWHFDGTLSSTAFVNSADQGGFVKQRTGCNLDTANKKFGTASLFLDGTDDFGDAEQLYPYFNMTHDYTIECWIKTPGGGAATQGILSHSNWTLDASGEWDLYLVSGKATFHYYEYAGVANPFLQGSTNLNNNAWHHIAVVHKELAGGGESAAIYVDGVAEQTRTTTSKFGVSVSVSIGANFYFGQRSFTASTFFRGWLDEVAIWDTARYVNTFTPNTIPYGNPPKLYLLDSYGDNFELYKVK